MANRLDIAFVKYAPPQRGTAFFLTGSKLALGKLAAAFDKKAGGALKRAAEAAGFEGEARKAVEILAPAGADLGRAVFVGVGDPDKIAEADWLRLGGSIAGRLREDRQATVVLEQPGGGTLPPECAATLALGMAMRGYRFDQYKTKKDKKPPARVKVRIQTARPRAAAARWRAERAVAEGIGLSRDLVNEPANILGPVEFAGRLKALSKLGLDVRVYDEKAIGRKKMGALLGVAQGSRRPARVVIMKWKGGKAKERPLALVGKGVVFDTGGISIKPSVGMEDMKGDMGGAAAVAGTMCALAGRKARANVVGIVGLVENMPDGNAQRPGDIVTSMSGQTIEVINTDAEGRLVLADILTFIQRTEKPCAMIDLATLTGAIIVALGKEHAGLFSNNDGLAANLATAGTETGEKVWRLPLAAAYDKLIDSRFADMKNVGGRWAGSITAAQFLQRYVENDTPWAHIDVAGTAMASPASDTNRSWASGFGVRLLDRLVRDNYEKK